MTFPQDFVLQVICLVTLRISLMIDMPCRFHRTPRMSGPLPTIALSRPKSFVPTSSYHVGIANFSISSMVKRDTHQLYDRSRDRRNIDPEGGRWWVVGDKRGRGRLMLPRNCVRSVRNSLNHTRNTRLWLQNKSSI